MYYFIKMLKKIGGLIKYFGDLLFNVLNDCLYVEKIFFCCMFIFIEIDLSFRF